MTLRLLYEWLRAKRAYVTFWSILSLGWICKDEYIMVFHETFNILFLKTIQMLLLKPWLSGHLR